MKAGSERDVSALANTGLDTGGYLAVEEGKRGAGAGDRDIAPVGQERCGRDRATSLHGQRVPEDEVDAARERLGASRAVRGDRRPALQRHVSRRDVDIAAGTGAAGVGKEAGSAGEGE